MKRPLALILLLAACREDVAEAPAAVPMTDEALGHFCQMALAEMDGPKAQVHLQGQPDPIFFAQVRDGVAYLKEPEVTQAITAFYVSDLSVAPSWEQPGKANWILASEAHFVVGADVRGGMGAPELAPFSIEADAQGFAAAQGGEIMTLADIPASAVLGAVEAVALHGGHE